WLASTNTAETIPLALLLAQYGEFDGVDRLAAQLSAQNGQLDNRTLYALLTGMALSHDAKYVPTLKQLAAKNETWLRKILAAMKGMSGPEARQLRLDINKKIRNADHRSEFPD
ncbi:MAG TPA: hypothetical protein VF988_04070, partial [Verrucomicrobiae bacterium]